PSTPVDAYRGDREAVGRDLRAWLEQGRRVLLSLDGAGMARRVAEVLGEQDVPHRLVLELPEDHADAVVEDVVTVTCGWIGRGFALTGTGVVVVGEADLTGQSSGAGSTRDMRRMPSRRRQQVDPLALRPGDFVVHEQH